jgi:hypothetical protein
MKVRLTDTKWFWFVVTALWLGICMGLFLADDSGPRTSSREWPSYRY